MKAAFPIGILVEIGQSKAGFQLAANLFIQGMRELNARIIFFQLLHLVWIFEWIKCADCKIKLNTVPIQ